MRGNNKFDLDFCTTKLNDESKYEHSWSRLSFNKDLISILREYGRLPIASLKESMDVAKEHTDQKAQI